MFYIAMEVRNIMVREVRGGAEAVAALPTGILWDLYTNTGPFEWSGKGSLKECVRKKLEEILKQEVMCFQMFVFDIISAKEEKEK